MFIVTRCFKSSANMLRTRKVLLMLLASCAIVTDAARILAIYPTPSISHQVVFRPITQELVKRGHEVIVITPDPIYVKGNAPANLTEIDVHDISYKHWHELLLNHKGHKSDLMLQIKLLLKRFGTTLDLQLQAPESQEVLKKDRKYFDLILLEACNRAALGIQKVFDAPIIQIGSLGTTPFHYYALGAPMHPILYPTINRQRLYNLSMWEKFTELLKHVIFEYLLTSTVDHDLSIMRKHFGNDITDYKSLLSNVQMLFVNEHPIWSDNRPLPPNILYIGGIHKTPEKELPKDLKQYLDSSKHGVIYVSFGTNVITSLISPEKISVMTKVFSTLPYDILMKWDQDELPGQPPNVKIYKWFPQSDLLKHPKIKLFITQGGLQSTDETIDAAVPVIGIPMLGDQWYNAEKYVRHKIGLQLDIHDLNEEVFKNAIDTVINDKSYKTNMLKLRSLMRETPTKPLDLAIWWAEHIIKYGGEHLRPPAAFMHWTEYYEVKLVAVVLSVLIIILAVIIFILKTIFTFLKRIFLLNTKLKTL